ncbi:hypothetical protein B0H14DRAFT_451076 [Mycena olivaceomarginata]|nr:hypothetical protein B0H14DRAFT_451076 [Mycena olivaceomarginata]
MGGVATSTIAVVFLVLLAGWNRYHRRGPPQRSTVSGNSHPMCVWAEGKAVHPTSVPLGVNILRCSASQRIVMYRRTNFKSLCDVRSDDQRKSRSLLLLTQYHRRLQYP